MNIISVFSFVSGVGTSTVAANIASYIASEKTLLIDLSNTGYGSGILTALGLDAKIKEDMYSDISNWQADNKITTSNGLTILPGSNRIKIDPSTAKEIIETLANEFDNIVLDLGCLRDETNELFSISTFNILVAEPSQRCLVKNKNLENHILTINKVSSKNIYHPRDIARWLNKNEYFELPEDIAGTKKTIQQQVPLIYTSKKYNSAIEDLVGTMFGKKQKNEQFSFSFLSNMLQHPLSNSEVPQSEQQQKLIEQHTESIDVSNVKKVRTRQGIPVVVLGLGSKNLNDWFTSTFSGLVDVAATSATPEELKHAVGFYKPDIVIIMRPGPMGGLTDAGELAEWATKQVPAVLFIAGELDEQGITMSENVKLMGGHVLACPPGETISGDELVFLVRSIITDLTTEPSEQRDQEKIEVPSPKKPLVNLDTLKKGATQLSTLLKQSSEKKKPGLMTRIKSNEGLSLEEDSPVEVYSNNIKNPTAIVAGGLFAVVSPWRPGLAGRIAAAAAKMFADEGDEVAVIGASSNSTVAVWLDTPEEELMMSDWRVPGSQAPIEQENIKVWAVDPAKALNINIDDELWHQIKEVRKTATYIVVDFAGDFELAQKAAFQGRAVVLVIIPGGDPVEQKTSMLWLNRFMEGKQNIVTGIDLRGVPPTQPKEFKPKVVVRNNPADALKMALRKNLDEFVWN